LASARKRFPFYQSLLWSLGTLFFPLIVLPLYFIALLLRNRQVVTAPTESPASLSAESVKWRFAAPLIYAALVLMSIAVYLYRDAVSVDEHLARAAQHRINDETAQTITEYKQALELEDNPHTHKLLAIELAKMQYWTDALSEFRLALKGGEPDDSIHFSLGLLLDQIELPGEANLEYDAFLNTATCLREPADGRCEEARQRVRRNKPTAGLE